MFFNPSLDTVYIYIYIYIFIHVAKYLYLEIIFNTKRLHTKLVITFQA